MSKKLNLLVNYFGFSLIILGFSVIFLDFSVKAFGFVPDFFGISFLKMFLMIFLDFFLEQMFLITSEFLFLIDLTRILLCFMLQCCSTEVQAIWP